jgi:hypothetical protein
MFRFTIRDVLWLTVVVGLAIALALNHFSWMRFHRESTKSLIKANRELSDVALEMERKYGKLWIEQNRSGEASANR